MILRRFTDSGVAQFSQYLMQLKTEPVLDPPRFLLEDAAYTEVVEPEGEVQEVTFGNRLEAAQYLDQLFTSAGLTGVERDTGLWAWLTLFFFDQLCPPGSHGRRDPGEYSAGVFVRLIPAVNSYLKYYRHLLLGPYLIFRAHREHPERALALLAAPVHTPGEVVGQIAAYQELVTNRAVVEAATLLYVDPVTRKLKRGTSGKGNGAPRRLAAVLNQFDLTWDLYAMDAQSILALLPKEFDRFRNNEAAER